MFPFPSIFTPYCRPVDSCRVANGMGRLPSNPRKLLLFVNCDCLAAVPPPPLLLHITFHLSALFLSALFCTNLLSSANLITSSSKFVRRPHHSNCPIFLPFFSQRQISADLRAAATAVTEHTLRFQLRIDGNGFHHFRGL